jgi:uncharacterized protein (DUF2236 family)
MLVGGLRALMIQALHPLAMAGVAEHSEYRREPIFRLMRTVQYVTTVTFGTTEQARAAGDLVRHVHTYVNGTDPVTGRGYSAEDVDTLLWVHCVEVHSFLAAYRAYGGRLRDADQDRYLSEQVAAAALVGIPERTVPASRAAMRDYFASVRGELVASPAALEAIGFVVSPRFESPALAPAVPLFRLLADAAAGLVPRDLRELTGLERSRVRTLSSTAVVAAAAALPAVALRLPLAPRAVSRGIHEVSRLAPFAGGTPRLVERRDAGDAEAA